MEINNELVVCIYDDNAPNISDKILEAFECYLKSSLQNTKTS